MPTTTAPLDHVLRAVADPVRRDVLDRLRDGPATAGTLGADVAMSQPAFSQHLRVLREAGLVDVEPRGRERWYHLRAAALGEVHDWVARYQRFWTDALDRLGDHLDATEAADRGRDAPVAGTRAVDPTGPPRGPADPRRTS